MKLIPLMLYVLVASCTQSETYFHTFLVSVPKIISNHYFEKNALFIFLGDKDKKLDKIFERFREFYAKMIAFFITLIELLNSPSYFYFCFSFLDKKMKLFYPGNDLKSLLS